MDVKTASVSVGDSFISQLVKFCLRSEKEVSNLKDMLKKPAGSYPGHYDRGLKVFKTEVQQLKESSEELKSKILEIQPFQYFAESLEELVAQQREDVSRMEIYLKKYGYKEPPCTKQTDHSKTSDQLETESFGKPDKPNCKFNIADDFVLSPMLSDAARYRSQGRIVPVEVATCQEHTLKSLRVPSSVIARETQVDASNTPAQSSFSSMTKFSSTSATPRLTCSAAMAIDNWLSSVEAGFAVTPDGNDIARGKLLREKYALHALNKENKPPNDSSCQNSRVTLLQQEQPLRRTPDEPLLSQYSSSIMKKENNSGKCNDRTPEEPLLQSAVNQYDNSKADSNKQATPVEPILCSSVAGTDKSEVEKTQHMTPEEPLVSSYSCERPTKATENLHTPDEPVLSAPRTGSVLYYSTVDDKTEYFTPEEPIYSYQAGHDVTESTDKPPESPQLSDITQKLLNIRSLRFSDSSAESPPAQLLTEDMKHNKDIVAYKIIKSDSVPYAGHKRLESEDSPLLGLKRLDGDDNLFGSYNRSDDDDYSLPVVYDTSHGAYKLPGRCQTLLKTKHQTLNCDDIPKSPELSDITHGILKSKQLL